MLLTWRMYTRHTLASLETILFFLVYIIWIVFSWVALRYITGWSLEFQIPRALILCDLYTFIFVAWLLLSLMGYRLNESYDLNKLRVYPLPCRNIFAANLLGAFTDISVILPLVGYVAVFIEMGPAVERLPVGLILILALLFLQVASGLTLVNMLYVLLPRTNLIKVGMWILFGVLIWAVLLNLGIVGYPMPDFYILFREFGIDYFRPWPAGQIGIALDAYLSADYAEMTSPLLGFAAWTTGVLGLNYLILFYWMRSDVGSREPSGHVAKNDIAPRLLDFVGRFLEKLVGCEAYALYRKDALEFASRSPYFFVYKILPGSIAPMIILLAMRWNLSNLEDVTYIPGMLEKVLWISLGLVLFVVIAGANLFAGNVFGFEDKNIRTLMVLPTPRRALLIGKNLFLGGLLLLDALVLSFLSLLFFPNAFAFFGVLSLTVTLFMLILSIGNFASSLWPYWMPLDQPSFTLRSTVILGVVNLGVTIALVIAYAPALAAVAVPYFLGIKWLAYLLMPVAVVYGFIFYRLTLSPAVGLLESNEFLVLRRIADREEL